jgi:hypothetical protein
VKIFFSGSLAGEWMSGWQRCQCLEELGHEVITFDQQPYLERAGSSKAVRVLTGCFYDQKMVEEFNRDILAAAQEARPDIAWLEWPMLLHCEALADLASRLPRCKWVSFQDDNPFGFRPGEKKRWKLFLEAIPGYHMHLVKRQHDIPELRKRGAKSIRIFRHGFFERLFHPSPRERVGLGIGHDVSFVGSPLDDRPAVVSELLGHHDLPLQVYGNRWHRTLVYHWRRQHFYPAVLGQDYVRVIWDSRISLGFVSASNRDEYTMRTFEIPACKGFLLAERTSTHQDLFTEGQEAEFFSSTDECADKIKFYLKTDSARNRIAEGGYSRCLKSDYSLRSSVAKAIAEVRSLQE